MRGVLVNNCLALLDAMDDVIVDFEEYFLTFPAIIWSIIAIFIL